MATTLLSRGRPAVAAAEIARMVSELEAAREGIQQGAEALEGERRAHEQTKSETRDARALAEEREKRIAAQEKELQELRRQIETLRIEATTLTERAVHADELRGVVQPLQAGQGRGSAARPRRRQRRGAGPSRKGREVFYRCPPGKCEA